MLLLSCPYCGPRAEIEFHWGGEAHLARPYEKVSDPEWGEYLYFRKNPKGTGLERWRHTHGCGQWFNIARDTTTHRVLSVYRMGEQPPADLLPTTHESPAR